MYTVTTVYKDKIYKGIIDIVPWQFDKDFMYLTGKKYCYIIRKIDILEIELELM